MYLIKFSVIPIVLSALFTFSLAAQAIVDGHEYQFNSDDVLQNESRAELFKQLAEELRCPKCQNQNLSDSNAMIAGDLRRELYSQVQDGKNSEEIVDFMVNRYGEFVLYRPALNNKTLALWYGPFVLLALAILVFVSVVLARKVNSNPVKLTSDNLIESVPVVEGDESLSVDEQKRLDELLNPVSKNQDNKKGDNND
jgi:cytochrome c-type biogenesis protein CcmH